MHKISIAVGGFIVGLSTVCMGADKLTFSAVQPVADLAVMDIKGLNRKALKEALDVHNLMVELRDIKTVEEQVIKASEQRQLYENKLAAMEKCSVDKLSSVFKNPNDVWRKMTSRYTQKEKDLTIYVNASQVASEQEIEEFNAYMNQGLMTDGVASELLSQWQIGRDILTDVYANQDSWGERKTQDAPSFPLWEDQKYLFDKEWNKKYEAINLYFGVPPQGRPLIGDERYDYAKADELEKAHNTYLALLAAKNPVKAATLPNEMKKVPVAPKPLPPKMEYLVYLESADPKKAIYPSLPEPWQEYEKKGFSDISPKGEMASDFSSGLNLKEEAKKSLQGNRLTKYASLTEDVDGAKRYENVVVKDATSRVMAIWFKISNVIPLAPDVNLLDADERKKVLGQLQERLRELISKAEVEMNENKDHDDTLIPESDLENIEDLAVLKEINPAAFEALKTDIPNSLAKRDELLLKALKTDEDGLVFLNEVNAGDVDKMLKEHKALEAFMAENTQTELNAQPIDETCLNGGI